MAELRYVDWDGLVYYDGKIKQYIDNKFEDSLKFGGSVKKQDLPCPSFQTLNHLYRITDTFTSDDYFVKPGYTYAAGTIVIVENLDDVYLYTIVSEPGSTSGSETDLTALYKRLEENELLAAQAMNAANIAQDDANNAHKRIDELTELVSSIEGVNLSEYAKKDEIPKKVSDLQNDVEYTTRSDVDDLINQAISDLDIPDADLSNYYTKEEVTTLIQNVSESSSEAVDELEGKVEALSTEVSNNNDAILDLESGLQATNEKTATIETTLETLQQEVSNIHIPTNISELENDANYVTETFVRNAIAEAELNDKDVDLSGYATKDDLAAVESKIPSVENLATKQELEDAISSIEHPQVDLTEYVTKDYLGKVSVNHQYEVLPIDGMFIQYEDHEIRLNTQRVQPTHQNVGSTGNPNNYYATFRAFAPEGATRVIEGKDDVMDEEFSILSVDEYGRKYTVIWITIASYDTSTSTWSLFGDKSSIDKYLGFYFNFHWYNEDTLISTDKVRILLTNDACHNDLVPDAVARRIDDKISDVEVVVNTITEQVQNIEETYVTNETLEQNYVTNQTLESNYVTNDTLVNNYTTTAQLQETYVTNNDVTELVQNEVTEVIENKIESGEIVVSADSINYDTF